MARLKVLIHLQSFLDQNPSNNTQLRVFDWTRDLACLEGSNPRSDNFALLPGATQVAFNGVKSLSQDGSTRYSVAFKSGNTYTLAWVSGAVPGFALGRSTTQDNTSQVQVTQNGPLATFTGIAGQALGLGSVVPGDMVDISGAFNVLNQGTFKVISATASSFTIESNSPVLETVTLSAASDLKFYSLNNVQVGNTLRLYQGFSPASYGNYSITKVTPLSVEFFAESALPSESATTQVSVYESSKQFVYLETDKPLMLTLNGGTPMQVEPFVTSSGKKQGIFMLRSTIYSISLQSASLDAANVYMASIE